MQIWSVASKNLLRRPARSTLTAFGLGVAVAAVVPRRRLAIARKFLSRSVHQARRDLVIQRRGGAVQLSKGIKLSFGDQLRKIPGVQEVIGSLMDLVAFEDQDLYMVIVNGWEPDLPRSRSSPFANGPPPASGRRTRRHAGPHPGGQSGKQTGDHVQLYGQDFEVVGIFESFSVYENGGVFMLLDELQRQMDRPGEVTGFVIRRARQASLGGGGIRQQIEALDPHIAATPCAEFVSSLSQMKIARTMSWFTSTFAIVIGSIGVMNTMAMAVFERRAEIASLRAIGWRKWPRCRVDPRRIVVPGAGRRTRRNRQRDRPDIPAHAVE